MVYFLKIFKYCINKLFIMTDIELKAILKRTGRQLNEIATLINISPQALNQVLNSKDVKSGILESLASALGISVCEFYGGGDKVSAIDHSLAINGNGNSANNDTGAFLALLTKKDEQIDRLLGIIEQMNK